MDHADASVRVACEGEDGQYRVVGEATLRVDRRTLTVRQQQATLVHAPLASFTFGLSATKVMIVPKARGPCWLAEFTAADSAAPCLDVLRALAVVGSDLTVQQPPLPEKDVVREIAALSKSMEWQTTLASYEAALQRA